MPHPRSSPSESPISRTVQWPTGPGTPGRVLVAGGASAKPQPCPIVERVTGPDNAPGTVVAVGGGDVGLLPFTVVVVTGTVVVDVEVGATTTVVGEDVEANTADVTTSATNTAARADRSGQFALLARGGVSRVAGPDPPPLATPCCRPFTAPTSCGLHWSSSLTVVPTWVR